MRCEEKIPRGKLVCIDAECEDGRILSVKITGDFFLHPEERIEKLERALINQKTTITESEAEFFLKKTLGDGVLIGVSCADLARMIKKAVSA